MKFLAILARIVGLALLAFGAILLFKELVGTLYGLGIMACGLYLMFPQRVKDFANMAVEKFKAMKNA
jgi:hypothetical protein